MILVEEQNKTCTVKTDALSVKSFQLRTGKVHFDQYV